MKINVSAFVFLLFICAYSWTVRPVEDHSLLQEGTIQKSVLFAPKSPKMHEESVEGCDDYIRATCAALNTDEGACGLGKVVCLAEIIMCTLGL